MKIGHVTKLTNMNFENRDKIVKIPRIMKLLSEFNKLQLKIENDENERMIFYLSLSHRFNASNMCERKREKIVRSRRSLSILFDSFLLFFYAGQNFSFFSPILSFFAEKWKKLINEFHFYVHFLVNRSPWNISRVVLNPFLGISKMMSKFRMRIQ